MDWEQIPNLDLSSIEDVWMHMTGLALCLKCSGCGAEHEKIQATISGVPLGLIICPACEQVSKMTPELFQEVLHTWCLEHDQAEALAVNRAVTEMTESWYETEPWKSLLTYKGTNLGEPAEREVACHIHSPRSSRRPTEVHRD